MVIIMCRSQYMLWLPYAVYFLVQAFARFVVASVRTYAYYERVSVQKVCSCSVWWFVYVCTTSMSCVSHVHWCRPVLYTYANECESKCIWFGMTPILLSQSLCGICRCSHVIVLTNTSASTFDITWSLSGNQLANILIAARSRSSRSLRLDPLGFG